MKSKLFLLSSIVGFLFCAKPSLMKFIKVFLPNGVTITAQLAVSDEERQQGLMFREKINADQGMLFIFEEEAIHSFWMKNMEFPIDILWLDHEKRIVHVEHRVPPCEREPCPSYTPSVPGMYVLELKAGSVKKHGLRLYDELIFVLEKKQPVYFASNGFQIR